MKKNQEQASNQGVSRRQFLVGAGLAGLGVAGAGLAGCAPSGQAGEGSGAGASGGATADPASLAGNPLGANAAVDWTFATPPEDIASDQIKGTEDVDVLVVGSGFAGAIASVTAAEHGAKTLCIDKQDTWSGRGGHITAYGSKIVKQYAGEGWFEEADYARRPPPHRMGDRPREGTAHVAVRAQVRRLHGLARGPRGRFWPASHAVGGLLQGPRLHRGAHHALLLRRLDRLRLP
ncbi:MAG: FAD-binding protein [Eggerthellaceae bacterium]